MTTCARRAGIYRFAERLVNDVVPISWFARHRIELRPNVLENRFLVPEILAGFPIEFPQNAVFTDCEKQILATCIHKNALEHDVEIERFTWSMLEVPFQFAVVWINRYRRTRIVGIAFCTASKRAPCFRLGRSPVRKI